MPVADLVRTEPPTFTMPRLGALIRHASPRVVAGMIAPVLAFYAGFFAFGAVGGMLASLGWVSGSVGWYMLRERTVPGTMVLAVVAVLARMLAALLTGSIVIFFLQPALGTILVSLAFLASVPLGRPLAGRLACDLVPLSQDLVEHPQVRRYFARISLLWAAVQMSNAVVSLWLLLSQSIEVYLLVRTAAVGVLMIAAAAVTLIAFNRCLRRIGCPGAARPVRFRARSTSWQERAKK
ncbi:VC0807 family protein [Rhizohabitans arisaemae]|uniref:VC0807 family protein n=1 Tax=Rhizohabitans arisaemae TaxID=2720610 RepID=UPI0024B1B3B9|nr:VC0807 family protein [Rhizohabitans arisaemae]